jgi:hypothetical protein
MMMTSIKTCSPEDKTTWKRYSDLTRVRGKVAGQLASLATKLRLTTQSRSHPERAYTEAQKLSLDHNPWSDAA